MCRLLGVTRSGYYQNEKNRLNKLIDSERIELLEWIKKIAESSKYTYGSRRMKNALNALGYPLGRNKTRRFMKEAQIWVRYRKNIR